MGARHLGRTDDPAVRRLFASSYIRERVLDLLQARVIGGSDVPAGGWITRGDAVRVDGEQDTDAVPGAGSDLGGRGAGSLVCSTTVFSTPSPAMMASSRTSVPIRPVRVRKNGSFPLMLTG
jgi:hypothetical protein